MLWRAVSWNTADLTETEPYYRRDLALVHHRGYGFHADRCAPGILTLLEPVLARRGLVLELGCGALTRYLVDAGHRVIATDASPAMVDLARDTVGGEVEDVRQLVLPDGPPPGVRRGRLGRPRDQLPARRDFDRPGARPSSQLCGASGGRRARPTADRLAGQLGRGGQGSRLSPP